MHNVNFKSEIDPAQSGFTLVEVAMVLVILGLLLTVVLEGAELITNSKVKTLAKNFDGIRVANYAYIDRKSSYPGQAENGEIENAEALTDSEDDFFGQLASEGFILGQNITPPKGVAKAYEVYYAADQSEADLNNATLPGVNQICITGVDGQIARGMDVQFDDGEPDSGIMRAETAFSAIETEYEKGVKVTLCLTL